MAKASIRSKDKTSRARLVVSYVPSVKGGPTVFFDRHTGGINGSQVLCLHTTPKRARALAQWILDNVPADG